MSLWLFSVCTDWVISKPLADEKCKGLSRNKWEWMSVAYCWVDKAWRGLNISFDNRALFVKVGNWMFRNWILLRGRPATNTERKVVWNEHVSLKLWQHWLEGIMQVLIIFRCVTLVWNWRGMHSVERHFLSLGWRERRVQY